MKHQYNKATELIKSKNYDIESLISQCDKLSNKARLDTEAPRTSGIRKSQLDKFNRINNNESNTSVPVRLTEYLSKDENGSMIKPEIWNRKVQPPKTHYQYLNNDELYKFHLNNRMNSQLKNEQAHKYADSYTTFDGEMSEKVQTDVKELKETGAKVTPWTYTGKYYPAAKRNRQRDDLVEVYGEMAINLGINNKLDTELNCSKEGQYRRD